MTVTADQYAVCLRLAGDIDLVGEPDLARLAEDLAATRCSRVHIDLQPVTFAGSTLINFLFRLSRRTSVTLCRPAAMTRHLITLTGLNELAAVRSDLPADWTETSSRDNTPVAAVA
ncbi:STAS domain-containing protein [Catelliglobosispora koreensis]|uniref:STAS domain-containing protein n=1 Tax=Catelliglobosispora koreensis TaxID=129052 RepID=UPI0012F72C93|nr:STAS domain-containing protein [Catelliglobosispora koreensis]